MDYRKIAEEVARYAGGKENIKGATHCVTRLRLILNDPEKYDRKKLENVEGSKGVPELLPVRCDLHGPDPRAYRSHKV